jgi:hypothetical protein
VHQNGAKTDSNACLKVDFFPGARYQDFSKCITMCNNCQK